MPEIITKYPDIILQILNESGAECGSGVVRKILTACPPEQFCSLQTGEICVYGLNEIQQMTQISAAEITEIIAQSIPNLGIIFLTVFVFIIGVIVGILLSKKIKGMKK